MLVSFLFLCLVSTVTPQTFSVSFGATEQEGKDSIKSAVKASGFNFEDFFSSSKLFTPAQPKARTVPANQNNRRANSPQSDRVSNRGVPLAPRLPVTTPNQPKAVRIPAFNPFQRPNTSPVAPQRSSSSSGGSSFSFASGRNSQQPRQENLPRNQNDVSSRGRIQTEAVAETPQRVRPQAAVTERVNEVENLIGHSSCARGIPGDACRRHLLNTAMSCTSGFCKECQQCGNVSADLWPKCCREHFLCCRPLAKGCQTCDNRLLRPFCKAAFGRC